jgi:adenosine deaminase
MTFASGLPKAELHLHIEGTLEPEMVFRLARRNGVGLSYPDAASLARAYQFSGLQSFLTLYYAGMDVLRTSEDFYELADAYLHRAKSDGVRHAEIFFDPQAHLSRGVPLRDVVRGLSTAADQSTERYGISVLLIACFLRDRSAREAMDTLEALAEHVGDIHAVGLGFRRVAHAGEEGPPEFIWQALDLLGAERIDHGIRAVEDRKLLRRLAVDRVPLTVCPLSNVRLRCIDTIARHPLPALLDHGVLVSINSDDPAYFGGYIGANYEAIQAAFDLSEADLARVAADSFRSSFLPAQVISAHLASSRP